MAGRKDNLKALFTNSRTRVIIVFTFSILLLAIIVGLTHFIRINSENTPSLAGVTATPGIQSIPGALNPTVQYAKLQEAQNTNQAKTALKTGSSAIPTIVRSQQIGQGVGAIGGDNGTGGLGFTALTREDQGAIKSAWFDDLQKNSCSKSSVTKAVNEGAQLEDLKKACSCIQLKDNGYQLSKIQKVCSCTELKAAGFSARQLKDIGYTAGRLRLCGFDACELRNAGFTAQQMKDGGFSDGELKGAGFSDAEIAAASGLPNGITAEDVRKAGCGVDALKRLRQAGVSASAIRRISGCSAAQLKAAGFSAQNLKDAGFTAADLKKAGFTPEELRQAGFSARDLLNAGFTPDDLANAGFSPEDILAAETGLPPGISPNDVKKAGCDIAALKMERLAGISAKSIRKYAGCSAAALKAAGFTDADLANAGFSPQEIAALPSLDDSGIRAAGCDPTKLKMLRAEGVTAKKIHELNGCSAAQLKAAGFSAKDLLDAGFTPKDLLAAGFTPDEIKAASAVTDDAIRAAGCDPEKLRNLFLQGVSAKRIHELNGCSAAQLKAAGYNAKSLLDAGFSPADLLAAGFTPSELKQAGVNPTQFIAEGRTNNCNVDSLKAARAAGVSATTIRETLGCSAAALKAAGYTAAELKAAGFTAAELKAAGFSAKDLKDAGFSAAELKAAGFSAKDLKDAGFSAKDLKDAGFSAAELKAAGFSAKDLKDAGFSAKDLKDAGFSAAELKAAGFSAKDLKDAGFSASALKAAGFSADDLQKAGFNNAQENPDGMNGSNVASLNPLNQLANVSSTMPSVPGYQGNTAQANSQNAANSQQLQDIMKRQNQMMADQKYQQKIQQRSSDMLSNANQALQGWKKVSNQAYMSGTASEEAKGNQASTTLGNPEQANQPVANMNAGNMASNNKKPIIRTGDILFGVIDTSINSDEPGPILATIVSGKLKGSKLIGSFTLPSNADKMVIQFNQLSTPGASKTLSISAYAIDANTARTALSSDTNHHYLYRYGSLFASTFMEGFGNAFQSANTTVTVGGVAGTGTVTVQNGIGRSALENAVIGLATVGKSWAQFAQQNFNRPTTVQVYSGTGVGILFTQDLTSL